MTSTLPLSHCSKSLPNSADNAALQGGNAQILHSRPQLAVQIAASPEHRLSGFSQSAQFFLVVQVNFLYTVTLSPKGKPLPGYEQTELEFGGR